MPLIEAKNLRKEYRINQKKEGLTGAILNVFNPKYVKKVAVNNVNFSIEKGEMVGYIGANGAGKSTTIKMLTGILTPTSGEVIVNGLIPYKNRIKNNLQIGAVFGQRTQMWWDIPVIESYKLIKKIYEVSDKDYNENLNMFSELLNLDQLLRTPVRQLSLGEKMRCEIGATFIHNPKIVYLDEPTIGLDVVVKEKIREVIKVLNKEKQTTVILTTHDLQDIEEVCKRIIIIDSGELVYDGTIEDIKKRFGKHRVAKFKVRNVNNQLENILSKEKDLLLTFKDEYELHIKFDRQKNTAADVMNMLGSYCDILDLTIEEPTIESIVKGIYGKRSKV